MKELIFLLSAYLLLYITQLTLVGVKDYNTLLEAVYKSSNWGKICFSILNTLLIAGTCIFIGPKSNLFESISYVPTTYLMVDVILIFLTAIYLLNIASIILRQNSLLSILTIILNTFAIIVILLNWSWYTVFFGCTYLAVIVLSYLLNKYTKYQTSCAYLVDIVSYCALIQYIV